MHSAIIRAVIDIYKYTVILVIHSPKINITDYEIEKYSYIYH